MGQVLAYELKGHWFDSPSEHMPGLFIIVLRSYSHDSRQGKTNKGEKRNNKIGKKKPKLLFSPPIIIYVVFPKESKTTLFNW